MTLKERGHKQGNHGTQLGEAIYSSALFGSASDEVRRFYFVLQLADDQLLAVFLQALASRPLRDRPTQPRSPSRRLLPRPTPAFYLPADRPRKRLQPTSMAAISCST